MHWLWCWHRAITQAIDEDLAFPCLEDTSFMEYFAGEALKVLNQEKTGIVI
jgi:hypothetical protein